MSHGPRNAAHRHAGTQMHTHTHTHTYTQCHTRACRGEEAIVQWGGSGGVGSAVDMEAQEAILQRLFKPHKVTAGCLWVTWNVVVVN